MVPSFCKLVELAFTPIRGNAENGRQVRVGRHISRTNALLGQGSVPASRGFVITARDVRRMKGKVLAHDFRP